jgi:putative ABC transport system permease protein
MLSQTIFESFNNLWAAKQRSLLALLGIVIGTGSVIAMSNIGAIAEKHALEQILSTGVDLVVISLRQKGATKAPVVTAEDIDKLTEEASQLDTAIPIVMGNKQIRYQGHRLFGSTVASYPQVFDLTKLKLGSGRLLSPFDDLEFFCVMGAQVIPQAHGTKKAEIGDQLQIGSESYTIIGILGKADPSPMLPIDADSSIFVSFANARRIADGPKINTVIGRMAPTATAEATTSKIQAFFHSHLPGVVVRVQTASQLIKEMGQQVRTFSMLLGAIGSISLIVGGVGVMNVMLVSVTERRREIGIRMAVGARRRDIKTMFLIESLVLSVIGGMIGTIIGVGSSAVFAGVLGWTFTLAGYAIPLGVGVSMVVGVFFGIYPAASAAQMKPVDALRSE